MEITVTYKIDVDIELVRRCLLERDRYDAHADPNDDGYFDDVPSDDELPNDADDAILNEIRATSSIADIYNAPELLDVRYIDEHGEAVR